jgi:dCMP deaminase
MSDRWDKHFLEMAVKHSGMSKDPNTKVGAVIVGPDREVRAVGFNGFPRGVEDTPERLNDRELKLDLIVHAEMNAILAASMVGVPLKGCSLYLAATDKSGEIWGGEPCCRCVVGIIQTGIREIVSYAPKNGPTKWASSLLLSRGLIKEVGILYREVGH